MIQARTTFVRADPAPQPTEEGIGKTRPVGQFLPEPDDALEIVAVGGIELADVADSAVVTRPAERSWKLIRDQDSFLALVALWAEANVDLTDEYLRLSVVLYTLPDAYPLARVWR